MIGINRTLARKPLKFTSVIFRDVKMTEIMLGTERAIYFQLGCGESEVNRTLARMPLKSNADQICQISEIMEIRTAS